MLLQTYHAYDGVEQWRTAVTAGGWLVVWCWGWVAAAGRYLVWFRLTGCRTGCVVRLRRRHAVRPRRRLMTCSHGHVLQWMTNHSIGCYNNSTRLGLPRTEFKDRHKLEWKKNKKTLLARNSIQAKSLHKVRTLFQLLNVLLFAKTDRHYDICEHCTARRQKLMT